MVKWIWEIAVEVLGTSSMLLRNGRTPPFFFLKKKQNQINKTKQRAFLYWYWKIHTFQGKIGEVLCIWLTEEILLQFYIIFVMAVWWNGNCVCSRIFKKYFICYICCYFSRTMIKKNLWQKSKQNLCFPLLRDLKNYVLPQNNKPTQNNKTNNKPLSA